MKKHFGRIKRAVAIVCICSGGLISQASALSLTFEQVTNVGKLDRGGGGKDNEGEYIDRLTRMTVSTTLSVQSYEGDHGIAHDSSSRPDNVRPSNHVPTLTHGSKVPDSGSSLVLLGLSLTSIGCLRRMFRNSCRRDNNDP